jgi:NADH-quinone oxidoreductase subunit J
MLTIQTPEAVMFWVLGPLSVIAAIGMLVVKKAVHSALLLAWIMITIALFYIAQDAVFLGIVQIVVYTGAVMMLFLFILMLVGVDASDSLTETIPGLRAIAITASLGFGGLLVSLISRAALGRPAIGLAEANKDGNVQGLAKLLFSDYVFAFEAISALLITAALGAMVLAHHQRTVARPTQREQAIASLPHRFTGICRRSSKPRCVCPSQRSRCSSPSSRWHTSSKLNLCNA